MRHDGEQLQLDAVKIELREIWASIEEIRHPSTGHIATLKADLEKRIDQQESKFNGLVMAIITTVVGVAVAVGGEFIKKFVK